MGRLVRLQVSTHKAGGIALDHITNTVYLDRDSSLTPLWTGPDYQKLAVDAAQLWGSYRPLPEGYDRVEARVYDMEDAKPRVIRGQSVFNSGLNTASVAGPREVALCLSFFSVRNLPRQRGRLYVGPWQKGNMDERPSATIQAQVQALAVGIGNLGGIDVDWTILSPASPLKKPPQTQAITYKVTDYWIDNEWDTQRRRGLRSTGRLVGQTNE